MKTSQTISRGRKLLFVAAGLMMALLAQQAEAQRPAHFYPARPTFSPYLLYRQVNLTGIPNYYSYVRPATAYRDFLTRSQETYRPGQRQTLISEQAVARIVTEQLRERGTTGIGAAAVPAVYGNYSHFYSSGNGPRR